MNDVFGDAFALLAYFRKWGSKCFLSPDLVEMSIIQTQPWIPKANPSQVLSGYLESYTGSYCVAKALFDRMKPSELICISRLCSNM